LKLLKLDSGGGAKNVAKRRRLDRRLGKKRCASTSSSFVRGVTGTDPLMDYQRPHRFNQLILLAMSDASMSWGNTRVSRQLIELPEEHARKTGK
jgi:hypothetical protein